MQGVGNAHRVFIERKVQNQALSNGVQQKIEKNKKGPKVIEFIGGSMYIQ